jgi:hypothetical protein
MKPLIYSAIFLALPLWGCADSDPDQSGDDDAAVADAAPADPDAGDDDGGTDDDGAVGNDGGVQDDATAADAGADASPGADASTDSGAAGDAGPGADATVDSGADAGPQPTVIWTKRNMATTNLGAIGSQPYHQAHFGWSSQTGCSLLIDSPFYATGATGTATLTLTVTQQACLRNQFDCSVQTKVAWRSCGMASGCTTLQPGLVWETSRPACVVTVPAKELMLRHTVAALGAGGVDETWELVTP